jgi:acetyl-CoA C-acetyltransferase
MESSMKESINNFLVEDSVVIVSVARTPQGNLLGALKDVTSTELGAVAIKAALTRSNLKADDIQEVLMGCVLPAGLGQAPARQAALKAGLPVSTSCTTINKVCGSGMKAVMIAHDEILAGSNQIIIAGGMESMTNAPYLLAKGRQGYRLGASELYDHMTMDGLEDAYDKGASMGSFAETTAELYKFTRAEQDQYAVTSLERAQAAIQNKSFVNEIAPVTIKTKQGETIVDTDEHPTSVSIDKIPRLSAAYKKDGTITAASSSSIADGAAALVLMSASEAAKRDIKPLARIIGHSCYSTTPALFTTAPIHAIDMLLKKIDWTINQVDLFEINEAFAVVTMAAIRDLKIPPAKLNIYGGGCALGHPIGATGARIIVTLISALQNCDLTHGIASLCIGGGEATAIAIELL